MLKEASAIGPAPIYAFDGEHGDDNTLSILPVPMPKNSSRLQGILKGWGSRKSSGDTEASMPVGLKVVRIREPNRGSLGAVRIRDATQSPVKTSYLETEHSGQTYVRPAQGPQ